jgi:putative MATE family efflux protein
MKDFTKGNETKLILYFALPMLIGNILQQTYTIVDSIIVGRTLGKVALGAIVTTLPINFFILSLILGITMGSTIVIAQYYGAKDMQNLRKAVDTSFVFILISAMVIAILGYSFSYKILEFLKVPENIISQSVMYLKVTFLGIPLMFGYNIISSMLRGVGDSKRPLYFLMFSASINIILDILLVVVFNFGILGSAYATLIAQGSSFFIGIFYINRKNDVLKINFKKLQLDKTILYRILKIGVPAGVQYLLVSIGMMLVQSLINGFGTETITAFGAAGRIDSIGTMTAITFSSALSSFVAQNFGAGEYERAKKGFKSTIIMSVIIVLCITLIVQIFKNGLMTMFVTDKDVIGIGMKYLAVNSLFYIFPTIQFITYALLRGAGDSIIPMFISVTSLWIIRIPIAYFLSSKIGSGCIYWSNCASWVIGFVLAYGYYISGRWKSKIGATHVASGM